MKKINRILAVFLTLTLFVVGMASALNVSAAEAYVCDITINKTKSGCFEYMAYDLTNKSFYRLETEAKATWSPDWPGHFVPGKSIYAVSKSERDGALVDLMCNLNDNWGAAVVFTAPNDGKFNVVAELKKLYASDASGTSSVDFMLIKGSTGEVLLKEEKVDQGEVKWVKKNVELLQGEQVFIIVVLNSDATRSGGHNVSLRSLLVNETVEQSTTPIPTKPAETTPDPDDTTVPENIDNGSSEKIDPVVIIACVGGALVVVAVVIVIVVAAKKKSKK